MANWILDSDNNILININHLRSINIERHFINESYFLGTYIILNFSETESIKIYIKSYPIKSSEFLIFFKEIKELNCNIIKIEDLNNKFKDYANRIRC